MNVRLLRGTTKLVNSVIFTIKDKREGQSTYQPVQTETTRHAMKKLWEHKSETADHEDEVSLRSWNPKYHEDLQHTKTVMKLESSTTGTSPQWPQKPRGPASPRHHQTWPTCPVYRIHLCRPWVTISHRAAWYVWSTWTRQLGGGRFHDLKQPLIRDSGGSDGSFWEEAPPILRLFRVFWIKEEVLWIKEVALNLNHLV